jgi:SPP1 gp7 family putative phage head morphogenesis protein
VDGLVEGFKDVRTAEEVALFESLYFNVQMFSGAKTANMILDFETMLVQDGKIVEFSVFKKQVLDKYNTYMKTWLSTEYNFVVESAKAAKRWVGIWDQRGTFDLLEYVTVGDSRVRSTHKAIDGIVKPVTDSFWNTYYPPWEWSCRCVTKSYSSEDIEPTKWV